MIRLVLRRLLQGVPTFVGVTLISFLIANAMPGDPLLAVQDAERVTPNAGAAAAEYRRSLGLDDALLVRYGRWVSSVAALDFGTSTYDHQRVSAKLAEALPNSALLALGALLLTAVGALLLGSACAVRPGGLADRLLSASAFFAYAVPGVLAAVLLLLFFAGGRYLQLFPLQGLHSPAAASLAWPAWLLDLLWHLVLPVVCLSYAFLAAASRYVRTAMIAALSQDYVLAARARGIGPARLLLAHALRNAALPLITVLGVSIPQLMGGSVLIEQIFAIPGVGRLSLQAIATRDYPTLMGVTTVAALVTMGALLVSDLAYELADPRLRRRGSGP